MGCAPVISRNLDTITDLGTGGFVSMGSIGVSIPCVGSGFVELMVLQKERLCTEQEQWNVS